MRVLQHVVCDFLSPFHAGLIWGYIAVPYLASSSQNICRNSRGGEYSTVAWRYHKNDSLSRYIKCLDAILVSPSRITQTEDCQMGPVPPRDYHWRAMAQLEDCQMTSIPARDYCWKEISKSHALASKNHQIIVSQIFRRFRLKSDQ